MKRLAPETKKSVIHYLLTTAVKKMIEEKKETAISLVGKIKTG